MSLWGISAGNPQEPKYLANTATPYVSINHRYAEVYADNAGWQLVLPSRANTVKTECLVAMGGLANAIGTPTMTSIYFRDPLKLTVDVNVAWSVNVAFNQQVKLLTGTPPTLNIVASGANTANIVATYAGGNGTSVLTFNFVTPGGNDLQGASNANTYLSVPAQPLAITAGGVLRAMTNINTNANTYIPAPANTPYPFTGRPISYVVQHPIVQISSISLGGPVTRNVASNVYVNFTAPVKIMGLNTPNVVLNVLTGNTTNASYASGNGTSNLRFTWTGPQFTANVVSVASLRQLLVSQLNDVSANAAVNTFVTLAVANAAGTLTPI